MTHVEVWDMFAAELEDTLELERRRRPAPCPVEPAATTRLPAVAVDQASDQDAAHERRPAQ